ncbi:MAG: plastocyanin/azurin family copper-binding protein [Tahibacter sp.]
MQPAITWIRIFAFVAFSTSANAATHNVTVGGGALRFSPQNLTIAQGDTVVFTNAGGIHNVVENNHLFRCAAGCDGGGGNGNLSSTLWSSSVRFDNAGSFGYFCEAHGTAGNGMFGNITVTPVTPTFTITPGMAGNWYDPAQDGHGVQIEILPGNVATAFWFTFDNAGNQVWINAAGTIEGDHVVMNGGRVLNGRFPPNFNSTTVERRVWGTLTFTFTDCGHGKVDWNSTDAAFTATGTMNLQRLTPVLAGLTCP